MPIPVFTSRIVLDPAITWTVQVQGGSAQTLATNQYYHLVSNLGLPAGNGQSFLHALRVLLGASGGSGWTVEIDSDLKIKIAHGGGGTETIDMPAFIADALGFTASTGYAAEVPTGTASIAVPTGAAGVTAHTRSSWLWCPGMAISGVGPEQFDPAYQAGVPSSAGAAMYAPDGSASFVSNGTQIEAELFFNGVSPYKLAYRPPWALADLNWDFATWWAKGPRLGRSFLFWRDKSYVQGSSAPAGTGSGATPNRYVEYWPSAAMRERPGIRASVPGNLHYWDITISGRLTQLGETLYA